MNYRKAIISSTIVLSCYAAAAYADAAHAAPMCKAFLNLPFWTCSQELSTGGGQGTSFNPKETRTNTGHPNCGGGDPGTHPGPHGPEGNGSDGTGKGRGPGPNGPQD